MKTQNGEISPASILNNLTTKFVGRNIIYQPVVSSTMDVARKAATEGAAEGTIVIAEEQTRGRGRLGRSWLSPRGSLAVSIILYPELEQLPRLNMVASLAIAHAIEQATGLKSGIKWPNDVLISGKKVCGIMVDSATRGHTAAWAIIGIGLNVNLDPHSLPEIAAIATSLSAESGHEVSRVEVLKCLLIEVESLYLAAKAGQPIHREWQSRLETLGSMVQVRSGELIEQGYAESIDKDGHLLLRRSDGSLVTVAAGEVTLRP